MSPFFIPVISDFFVPLVPDTERRYTYEEACELVLKATAVLGEDYTALLRRAAPLGPAGLLRADGERIALTDRGFLLSNQVILTLLG